MSLTSRRGDPLEEPSRSISVNRVHFPVTALGYGTRLGIWVQGCDIGCPGCIARDTWDANAVVTETVDELLARCLALIGPAAWTTLDGVTISGGEPFQQPGALEQLVAQLRVWTDSLDRPVDLLCYSGLSRSEVERRGSAVLQHLDAFIPEPYRARAGQGAAWRGSANQPIIPLTELGRIRYADDQLPRNVPIQVLVENGELFTIGTPRPGDLRRMEKLARASGVTLRGTSWRR